MINLSVVVPIYNEERYLSTLAQEQLHQLRKLGLPFELILSENGSRDRTLEIAKNLKKKFPEIKILSQTTADYGAAIRAGFLAARGRFLVLFDLDYFDINFLKVALPHLKYYAAVIAKKRGNGAEDQRSVLRQLATLVFSSLLRLLFNLKLSDTHGIKILNRQRYLPLISRCQFSRDIFDTELLIRGGYLGLPVKEIGIVVAERRASRSSILKRSLRTLGDLLKLKLELNRERVSV